MPSSGTGSGMVAEAKKGKGWRELQGENSRKGLLDPLDLDLRKSIISYGELAGAAGDAFNAEERSPHLGACLYRPSHLLSGTGVAAAGHYGVTKFLYATLGSGVPPSNPSFLVRPRVAAAAPGSGWDGESNNFMGYVAVATDEGVAALGRRDIVVAWRGTVRPLEWENNLSIEQVDAKSVLGPAAEAAHPNAKVHKGFLSLYTSSNTNSKYNKTSARDQVHEEVRRLVEKYKDEEMSITITGHSLGGALSILTAVDIIANSVNVPADSSRPPCPVTAIVFACPQVGNPEFKTAFDSFQGLKALHVKNQGDIVPLLLPLLSKVTPTSFLFELLGIEYVDVGVTLDIHTDKSPYLRKIPDDGNVESCVTLDDLINYLKRNAERLGILHNLECYLHGVAGEQGDDAPFKLVVDRDVALVNKRTNALTEEHPVPANWWVAQNKHMVKGDDGHWNLNDFDL